MISPYILDMPASPNLRMYFLSDSYGPDRSKGTDYVSGILGYPDTGLNFGKNVGCLKYPMRIPFVKRFLIPSLLGTLERAGYDILFMENEHGIIGSTAFQVHEDNRLHVFSVKVDEYCRGAGLATKMHEEIVLSARKRGIKKVRFGAGGHEVSVRLHKGFGLRETELGIKALDDYWIEVLDTEKNK